MRESSLRAYRSILPQLRGQHAAICEWMVEHYADPDHPSPWTAAEIQAYMASRAGRRPTVHKRMKELERRRLVVRLPERRCRVTSHRVDTWALRDDPEFVTLVQPPSLNSLLSRVDRELMLLLHDEHFPAENDFLRDRLILIRHICRQRLQNVEIQTH